VLTSMVNGVLIEVDSRALGGDLRGASNQV